MDAVLGLLTAQATNYVVRNGFNISISYAFRQTSRLLKTVDDTQDHEELQSLQQRLDGKIRIISPAIDMIELISARGNTTLESAVALTRALRWDIQSLGVRLAKAAAAEESSRRKSSKATSLTAHKAEIRCIIQDIRNLLTRIEDAVPLINLAITTSGASLSTSLPATVSPSRLLQASTLLTAGDTQYCMSPGTPIQVGPTFTLSLYMLFTGHTYRGHDDMDSMRDTTWKEVIHKARVRLMRIPLQSTISPTYESLTMEEIGDSAEHEGSSPPMISGERKQNEYAYQIEIIEDLDDGRMHDFKEQPEPYGEVRLAGIREFLPIHQISKIFYANTGKILNIGTEGETNSPVLLLKRDVNALPPRRMMQESEKGNDWYGELDEPQAEADESSEKDDDSQDDINEQIRRESMPALSERAKVIQPHTDDRDWHLPADLDPEWLALEVYSEPEDSSSEDDQDDGRPELYNDSANDPGRPNSSSVELGDDSVVDRLAHLDINGNSSPSQTPARRVASPASRPPAVKPISFGAIRTSLSLMEMLIRLTSLQQFQQQSHLSIPDELLTFFLEESSTTGAGGNHDERRRTRREATQKVGFDPYDESPVKRRGEDYQYQADAQEQVQDDYYSGDGPPYDEYDRRDAYPSPRWQREASMPTHGTPAPWLLRSGESFSRRSMPEIPPSSPMSPYRPQRKPTRPLDRVQQDRRGAQGGSPLGRGSSVETDSTLGTSPGSPTLVNRGEKM